MANTNQARKRARQNEKKRLQNKSMLSMLRTTIKKFLALVAAGSKEVSDNLCNVYKALDSCAQKKLIHANKAARYKKRLTAKAKSASTAK